MLERYQRGQLRRRGAVVREIAVTGGTIRAMDLPGTGDGPTLMLLHGLGAYGAAFIKLLEHLTDSVQRIVLPDFPGHGLSADWAGPMTTRATVDAMAEAAAGLTAERPVLYGNSLGGYTALCAASARPDRFRGVVVTSPGGGALTDALREEVMQRFQPRSHRAAVDLIERTLTELGPVERHAMAVAARVVLNRPHVRQLAQSVVPTDDFRPEQMARLSLPVRIYWGTGERALHPAQRAWFQEHLPPHAELLEPEGWGHAAFREKMLELAAELRGFLASIPPERPAAEARGSA